MIGVNMGACTHVKSELGLRMHAWGRTAYILRNTTPPAPKTTARVHQVDATVSRHLRWAAPRCRMTRWEFCAQTGAPWGSPDAAPALPGAPPLFSQRPWPAGRAWQRWESFWRS